MEQINKCSGGFFIICDFFFQYLVNTTDDWGLIRKVYLGFFYFLKQKAYFTNAF